MKENSTLPQGTPRTDNPRILEWFGPNGKVLQLVKLPTSHHYRMTNHRQDTTYYSAKKWSLAQMLDILNR